MSLVYLETVDQMIANMEPGQRLDVPASFSWLWPNPPYPREDDYQTPQDRAIKWCHARGCIIWERLSHPRVLVIEKPIVTPQ